ncbi:MAG: creatininase family protein [Chloroflexota bacterium]|nr:creatininase family protein [Chloroflexota bacterium]
MNVYLHDMTSKEAAAALEKCKVVILPIGSVEWHGPHLPLSVDHESSRAFALAAAEELYPQVLVTHSLEGVVRGQMQFPGSITVPPHAFIEIMVGTCQSLNYHGVEKILILNGHGSNRPAALAAAIRASNQFDMQVVTASWWDFTPESAVDEIMDGNHIPGHAGDCETSLMMYLRPEMVNVDEALESSWEPEVEAGRGGADGWRKAGIDKSGAEKGEALFKLTLEHMTEWLEDFIAGKTSVVEPKSDREGYTVEFLGPRLWYFWAETNQQYMEQFRPRFIDESGRPYPGVELDGWGNPIGQEGESTS